MSSASALRTSRGIFSAAVVFLGVVSFPLGTHNPLHAEEPSAIQAAIEKSVVDAIAKCEKSVVAIGHFRRYKNGREPSRGFRQDPFSAELQPLNGLSKSPKDLDFVPTEYGTGVVLSQRGLILTNQHVLSEGTEDYDVEYWVVTSDRKSRQATVKAGIKPEREKEVLAALAALKS